jgi:hypothetical protein
MSEAFHSTLPSPPTLGGTAVGAGSGSAALSLLSQGHDHGDHGHGHAHSHDHGHSHGHAAAKAGASARHHTIQFPSQPAVGVLMWSVPARLACVVGLLLMLAGATAWALSGAAA